MSALFSSLTIKDIEFKNRIVVSPMCQYSSIDGFANDWHLVHLGSRAVGGAALILLEATAVSPEGRITPDDLGIWKDEHIAELGRINRFIEEHGAIAGVQLAHAGRKSSHTSPWNGAVQIAEDNDGWKTVAPSALAFVENESAPDELDEEGIQKVIGDFKSAASRVLQAGFKVLEIHAAHGYLLHEFYSPLSNHRKDRYGGSFENRIRLLLEIIQAVQEVWPGNLPMFVRISASDWVENGWKIEDSIALARILKQRGVDLIDCSSGGNLPKAPIPVGPLYQSEFAARIKQDAGILTGAVGLITSAHEAEGLIAEGKSDMVLLARQMLRDPYFPLRAATELGARIPWPVQYERAKPRI